MKHTVIALISQDPELESICGTLTRRRDEAHDRVKFLKKQMTDLLKKKDEADKADFDRMVRHLESKGVLKNYNPDKMHLESDPEANSITLCDHTDGGHPNDPFAALFGSLFPKD